jgi:DDE superfamily endonuclease
LQPIRRRVWAPIGQRPVAPVQPRYQWLYGDAFVRPSTGQRYWRLLPTVTAEVVSQALALFAEHVGAGSGKRSQLVLDQAGFHTAKGVVVPAGVRLEFLPAYSPELQPAERRWPLGDEALANRHVATLENLTAMLSQRCRMLAQQRTLVRAHTQFHWWPKGA